MMRSESDHRSPEVLHETPRGKDAQSHSTSPTAQVTSVSVQCCTCTQPCVF